MLKLPEPTLTFKGEYYRDFLKNHDNGLDLLPKLLKNHATIPKDITSLQVNAFKNPFQEISWLFSRVIGQENTASISCMILYILYFTIKEKSIFDWGKTISIEISSQLSQYKKDNKLFMTSYLVFTIAYCCQFPKLSICKKVNCEFDSLTFWYQALWRKKSSFHFYEVLNDFVSVFKILLFGKYIPRISTQECEFLDKKGTLEQMENYNFIRIFGSKENPFFLPCHISNIMFIIDVARKYNFWLKFFHEKRKNQFIPLPWKIRGFVFRNMNKIDEFSNHFHNLNLKYTEKIKLFDPNDFFVEHMLTMGFNNSFIHTVLGEEEYNNLGTPTHTAGDLETTLSTNAFYKKKGKGPNEKSS
jgi:hypothetical protein